MAAKENVSNNQISEARTKPSFIEDTGTAVPINWLDQSNYLPPLSDGDDSIFTALEGESSEVEKLNFLYISGKTVEKQIRAQEELLINKTNNTSKNIAIDPNKKENSNHHSLGDKNHLQSEKPFSPFPQMQYLSNLKNLFS